MATTSQAVRGESGRSPSATVTDQGGLVLGHADRARLDRGRAVIVGSHDEAPGSDLAPLTAAEITAVIEIAARAPSVHNTQPWRFRVTGNVIELHADPHRLLSQIDPIGRELMISCGAALFGVRLGFRQHARVPAVQLSPDAAQPWLLARVWPAEHAAVNAIEAELLAAVPHRHTHRGSFTPGEVSSRLLAALAVDAAAEGAELKFIDSSAVVGELATLVDKACAEQSVSAAISAETQRWFRPAGSDAHDGVPERATFESIAARQRFRQRKFGTSDYAHAGQPDGGDMGGIDTRGVDTATEPPVATAILVTAGDTRDDWLSAGQALNRLLLRAATRWVFGSLQSQPLESPRYRAEVRNLLELDGHPQMLLQFGRSNSALATPRRRHVEFRTNEKHV